MFSLPGGRGRQTDSRQFGGQLTNLMLPKLFPIGLPRGGGGGGGGKWGNGETSAAVFVGGLAHTWVRFV